MSIFKLLSLTQRNRNVIKPKTLRRLYRPWAEILEDRLTPTTTVNIVGTTLQIVGDDTANAVTVRLVNGDATKTEILDGTTSLGTFSNLTFTNIVANLNGGDDSFTLDSSNGNPIPVGGVSYDGGAGTNTFTGPDIANSWHITAANAGMLNTISSFTNVQSLVGGAAADTFQFSPGGNFDTSLDGGGGTNTLDYSALTTRAVVSIAGAAATGVNSALKNSVFNIQAAIGSSATSNLFVGPNADAIWNITGANAGTVVSGNSMFTFTDFPNLAGGSGTDTFKLQGSARLDGYADGGAGTNTLDYFGYSSRVVIDLTHQAATGFKNLHGSGVVRFQTLIGSLSATNLLVGSNVDATWLITGANSGNLNPTIYGNVNFASFAYLTGGFGVDTFKFEPGGSVSGALDGRDSRLNQLSPKYRNTLDYSDYGARVIASLTSNAATAIRNASGGGIFNIGNFIGSTAGNVTGSGGNLFVGPTSSSSWRINTTVFSEVYAGDTFGPQTISYFSAFPNVTGGAGNDIFGINLNTSPTCIVDGGGGQNTIDYEGFQTPVTVNLNTGTATGYTKVFDIQNVVGGDGNDTIIGGPSGGYLVGNGGNDTIIGGAGRSIIIGGEGSDTLKGGGNDDLIIAGITNFDVHPDLLFPILAIWQRTDIDYATRIADLRAGTGLPAGIDFVLGKTVFLLSGENDTLTGDVTTPIAGELDWFFAYLPGGNDTITDLQNGEQVN